MLSTVQGPKPQHGLGGGGVENWESFHLTRRSTVEVVKAELTGSGECRSVMECLPGVHEGLDPILSTENNY